MRFFNAIPFRFYWNLSGFRFLYNIGVNLGVFAIYENHLRFVYH